MVLIICFCISITYLISVRVCEGSGEVLMTEERDLAAILKEGKQLHVGFSPVQPLATLYSVFSALLAQPTGHYLLHHDSNTNAFIQLMKASNPNRLVQWIWFVKS